MRDENQLHAAVVELVALDDAEIKYSTVQNWYPGDAERQRRHLQLRHQARRVPRRAAQDQLDAGRDRLGHHLEISELRAARRGQSVGEFYSVAVTNNRQQADTGTKMIHIGKNTAARIVSKGISGRALGQHLSRPGADRCRRRDGARNFTQCDSPADRRRVRRAHRALHREPQSHGEGRARGDHRRRSPRTSCSTAAARAVARRTRSA
jgi:Fe-S cluster assembly protein SufB